MSLVARLRKDIPRATVVPFTPPVGCPFIKIGKENGSESLLHALMFCPFRDYNFPGSVCYEQFLFRSLQLIHVVENLKKEGELVIFAREAFNLRDSAIAVLKLDGPWCLPEDNLDTYWAFK